MSSKFTKLSTYMDTYPKFYVNRHISSFLIENVGNVTEDTLEEVFAKLIDVKKASHFLKKS